MELLNPGFAQKQIEYEQRRRKHAFESAKAEGRVRIWDPLKTKFEETLVIMGSQTPKPWMLPMDRDPGVHRKVSKKNGFVSPCGNWLYMKRILPAGEPLQTVYNQKRGIVMWTLDHIIPVLFINPDCPEVMMSVTPSEVFTLRPGIRKAKGEVVVGGLGMGWFLNEVAKRRKQVTKIHVVEKDAGLLDWYGRKLIKQIETEHHVKINLIEDDVFERIGTFGKNAMYLLDVWRGLGDAAYCGKLRKARKHLESLGRDPKKIWAWGENVYGS